MGAAIQAGPAFLMMVTLVPLLPETVGYAIQNPEFWIFVYVTVALFLVGIVYSYFASFAFSPKKFFSPYRLQIVTFCYLSPVFLGAASIESFLHVGMFTTYLQVLYSWFFWSAVLFGFLAMMAIAQFFLVRILVGRDGVDDAITCIGYEAHIPYDAFIQKFRKYRNHPVFGWSGKKDRRIYQFFRYLEVADERVVLLVAPSKDAKATRIVLATYTLMPTTILKSPYAQEMLDEAANDLKKSMPYKYTKLGADDPLFDFAKKEGLSPTRPAWFGWTKITTSTKGMIGGLFAMLALFSGLYALNKIGWEYYATFLLFAGIDLVIVVIPALITTLREPTARA
jgi:hypothetical protein